MDSKIVHVDALKEIINIELLVRNAAWTRIVYEYGFGTSPPISSTLHGSLVGSRELAGWDHKDHLY